MIGGQRIQVGLPHAGKTAEITIHVEDGITITARRTTSRDIKAQSIRLQGMMSACLMPSRRTARPTMTIARCAMVDIAEAVEMLAGPVAEAVPMIAAHIPPDLAAELGRPGAACDEEGQTSRGSSAGNAADSAGSPVLAALRGPGPVVPERLLNALELTVADLALAATVDLSPLLGQPPAASFYMVHSGDESQAVTAVRFLELLRPGAAELAAELATRLAGHPMVAPLLAVGADVTGEAPIAAAHGTAYLALAVAAASAVLGDWRAPTLADSPAAAVTGVAVGTAALLLRDAPVPTGYAAALQATARQEDTMPNYIYNVVYRGKKGGVIWERDPQSFPGSAREFAREKLLAWMADNRENENWLVVVNVWDADREGAGDPSHKIGRMSNHELDEGPFDPDQINVPYGQYRIYSVGYDLLEDPVLFAEGTDSVHLKPYGLIAPGEGPALAIWAGHEGWISLKVALRDTEPAADLEAWEAVEQVTMKPMGEVRVADITGEIEDHYPDLRGGHDTGYLAIRVSVRGRDKLGIPASPLNPRRIPLEDHLIEAWPVAGPAPRVVLKRDEYSRRQETSHGGGRS